MKNKILKNWFLKIDCKLSDYIIDSYKFLKNIDFLRIIIYTLNMIFKEKKEIILKIINKKKILILINF